MQLISTCHDFTVKYISTGYESKKQATVSLLLFINMYPLNTVRHDG